MAVKRKFLLNGIQILKTFKTLPTLKQHIIRTVSSVHINESKVLHKTEVTSFLTAPFPFKKLIILIQTLKEYLMME